MSCSSCLQSVWCCCTAATQLAIGSADKFSDKRLVLAGGTL